MTEIKASRFYGLLWTFQLLSGFILAIILALHFWVLHYSSNNIVTYKMVAERLANPLWKIIDITFLALVLYHAVNGVRGILLDFGLNKSVQKFLLITLSILAIIFFVFGFRIIYSVV